MIFIKTLQKMLMQGLILQIINYIGDCLKEKNKKVIGLMKDELDGKIIMKFVWLRGKTYSYLTDDGSEDKKAKGTKRCVMKRNFRFENYKIVYKQLNLRIK